MSPVTGSPRTQFSPTYTYIAMHGRDPALFFLPRHDFDLGGCYCFTLRSDRVENRPGG